MQADIMQALRESSFDFYKTFKIHHFQDNVFPCFLLVYPENNQCDNWYFLYLFKIYPRRRVRINSNYHISMREVQMFFRKRQFTSK